MTVEPPSGPDPSRRGVAADVLGRALAGVPADARVHVLMRHSLRSRPRDDAPGFTTPLTTAGVALARAAGGALGRVPGPLLASPAPRCVETAAALAQGAGVATRIERLELLAEPDAFAADPRIAGPFFLRAGARGWVQGVLADPAGVGAREPSSGTRRILAAIRAHAPPPGGIAVAVTHDTVLAVILHVLAGVRVRDEALWPLMLEAALLWWDETGVHWRWRDRAGHWRGVAGTGSLC